MGAIRAVMLVLAVAAVAFPALLLLVSHLRYRSVLLAAEEEVAGVADSVSAALVVLDRLRKRPPVLLRVLPGAPSDLPGLKDLLGGRLRSSDRLIELENGSLLILADTSPARAPRMAERLESLFVSQNVAGGEIRKHVPEGHIHPLLEWMRAPRAEGGSWRHGPEEWPHGEEGAEPSPSVVDALTGVLRSERVPQAMRRLLAARRKRQLPWSLLRVDVDHLEDYNRAHGREAGDTVLRGVARLLMDQCRETDLVGRTEEDEFVVCVPVGPEKASGVAARLCEGVKGLEFLVGDARLKCTVSAGIASYPDHGLSPNALFSRAGIALAETKRRGRGRCGVFDPETCQLPGSDRDRDSAPESF